MADFPLLSLLILLPLVGAVLILTIRGDESRRWRRGSRWVALLWGIRW